MNLLKYNHLAFKTIILVFMINIIFSAPVSMNNARRVADNIIIERFIDENSSSYSVVSFEKIESNDIDLIYIFHLDPIGFVLVPADNRVAPILAYSFESNFLLENMPGNVAYIMNLYQSEILDAIESGQEPREDIFADWEKYLSGENLNVGMRNMDPLIEVEWFQEYPYNYYCPEDDDGDHGYSLAGAPAVAMAQIMHYHAFPALGGGGAWETYNWNYIQYVNFNNALYDFANMSTDTYGDSYLTPETAKAAYLIWHAGVAAGLNYFPNYWNCYNCDFVSAFIDHFFYDDIEEIARWDYEDAEFIDILKNELDNYRPIFYGGGHSYWDNDFNVWNIDGYQGDLFHMNWGWGGWDNGYYTLDQSLQWTEDQRAIINIMPSDTNSPKVVFEQHQEYDTLGDGDMIINPGETFQLIATFSLHPLFNDAENIILQLTSEEAGINIQDDTYNHGPEDSPDIIWEFPDIPEESPDMLTNATFSNLNDPFLIQVDPGITLGDKTFLITSTAEAANGQTYESSFEIDDILISLNQYGFPINEASEKTSPLVIDLDGDGDLEIIVGDKNFFVHIYNADGTEVDDDTFPFNTGGQILGSAAAADMDGDGLTDFVITSKSKHLYIFDKNGLKTDFYADKYLLGTPAIGNLDEDTELEVVFASYGPGDGNGVWAINSDGSIVEGFPINITPEKVKIGVALADFNGNGRDDIVVGTDDDYIHLFYDDGSEATGFPYQTGDKIQSAPSILDVDGQKVIFAGSKDNNLYAINSDGSLRFSILAEDDVLNSPAFVKHSNTFYVFFSDDSGNLYAVDTDGNALSGWPVDADAVISESVVFSDLDGDGEAEVIAVTELADVLAYNLDGSQHIGFPVKEEFSFTAAPIIIDIDSDGDLEILAGSTNSLVAINIQTTGSNNGYWSMYRGNNRRTGYECFVDECGICGGSGAEYGDTKDCCEIELDECEVCGGSGIPDGECDCAGNVDLGCGCGEADPSGCDNQCGSTLEVDECEVCGGSGIPDGECDCAGNVDLGCGCGENDSCLAINELIIPDNYSISSIYPNPFNPITNITYGLPENTEILIEVYDIAGQQITTLINTFQTAGYHIISWNATSYPSGVYLIRMDNGDPSTGSGHSFTQTKKVVLVK